MVFHNTTSFYYTLTDHLGSIDALCDENGSVVERYSYDACSVKLSFCEQSETKAIVELIPSSEANREGNRRNPSDWTLADIRTSFITNRGFTGHEHLDKFGLINANARMYEPLTGKFLAPDPYVQAPDYSQSFNRYTYCWNNPVKYSDPSGEIILPLLFTDFGYEIQKYISPVAVKINIGVEGVENFHIGIEVSIGVPKASPISYRYHWGSMYYSDSYYDDGVSGHVSTNGREITYLGFFSLSSTQYHSKSSDGTSTSQTVGRVMVGNPLFNLKYQNDWHPEWMNKLAIGFDLYDGGDRYRSAAMQINAGPFKAGFNLFTGDPGLDGEYRESLPGKGIHAGKDVYVSGNANKYRRGVAYYGFGPIRFSRNSEMIRHGIQNKFAHDWIQEGRASHFQVLNVFPTFFLYYGTGYGSGLW